MSGPYMQGDSRGFTQTQLLASKKCYTPPITIHFKCPTLSGPLASCSGESPPPKSNITYLLYYLRFMQLHKINACVAVLVNHHELNYLESYALHKLKTRVNMYNMVV